MERAADDDELFQRAAHGDELRGIGTAEACGVKGVEDVADEEHGDDKEHGAVIGGRNKRGIGLGNDIDTVIEGAG